MYEEIMQYGMHCVVVLAQTMGIQLHRRFLRCDNYVFSTLPRVTSNCTRILGET
jgi:hypothetical protein